MSYRCGSCSRSFSTPFNLSRHMRKCQPSDDEDEDDGDVDEVEDDEAEDDEAEESDDNGSEDEDRDSWLFLFKELREKELDIKLGSLKLKKSLIKGRVSEAGATNQARQNYFKLLAKELREQVLDLVLNMRILRKDSIFEAIMNETKMSDLPFAEGFRDAWKKHKDTIVEEVLKPTFPEEETEDVDSDENEGEEEQDYEEPAPKLLKLVSKIDKCMTNMK